MNKPLDLAKLARLLPDDAPPAVRKAIAGEHANHLTGQDLVRTAATLVLGDDHEVSRVLVESADLRSALFELAADADATFARLQDATLSDSARKGLADDLARTLPARRAAIVSSARTRVAATTSDRLDRALDVLVRVAVAVAGALV